MLKLITLCHGVGLLFLNMPRYFHSSKNQKHVKGLPLPSVEKKIKWKKYGDFGGLEVFALQPGYVVKFGRLRLAK